MAATEQWCKTNRKDFAAIWRDDGSPAEWSIHQFIGKDIIRFHFVFWPVMLRTAGFRLPEVINVHGHLTVNGRKMSKRHGTFITVETWLRHLPPESLRYYLATRMSPGPDDLDLNLDDFIMRVNADLVGKLVNIAARTATFIERYFDGVLAHELQDPQQLLQEFETAGQDIAQDFENLRFNQGIRKIMALAERTNRYLEEQSPWNMAQDESRREDLYQVCSLALNLFRSLMAYLSPVVPQLAERAWRFLNTSQPLWEEACRPLLGHRIAVYERLMERIDPKQVQAMVAESTIPEASEPPQCSSLRSWSAAR